MEKQYKVGIIGYGGMAHYHKIELNDKELDRARVVGVYDTNPERMELAKGEGLKCYSSRAELIADEELDIVLVATTNDSHKEIAIEALAGGKHVICEKPVTVSSAELLEIMEAAKKYNRIFTIDQNRRVNKDFVLMRKCIEDGMIGRPYVIESRVEGSRGVPAGWRTKKELGGGMMLDWGVHLIDQIMYMTDERVKEVYCKMFSIHYPEVDDNFRLTITFESGLLAHIEVGTNNYINHPRWYVLGENGTLQIDGWDCTGRVVACRSKEDEWGEEILNVKAGPSKTMAPRTEASTKVTELSAPEGVMDNLRPVYYQLIDAIEKKAELKITPNQALRVMKVMEAAFLSSEKGEVIKTNI